MSNGLYRMSQLGIVAAFVFTVLYGVSCQQYRFYSIEAAPRLGLGDSISYLEMAHGEFNNITHRNRPIIPCVAGLLESLVITRLDGTENRPHNRLILAFYSINFTIIFCTAIIFFLILEQLGFRPVWCLIGVTMFLTSRVVIYETGVPLVDSGYFLAIATMVYLMQRKAYVWLAILSPLLVLTKETVLPLVGIFMILHFRWWTVLALILSILSSYLMMAWVAQYVTQTTACDPGKEFAANVWRHYEMMSMNKDYFFSADGLYDLLHSFGLFLPLAVIGMILNRKNPRITLPPFIAALFPLSILYAFMSSNMGRMFFAAFPVIIPYALIALMWLTFIIGRRSWRSRAMPR